MRWKAKSAKSTHAAPAVAREVVVARAARRPPAPARPADQGHARAGQRSPSAALVTSRLACGSAARFLGVHRQPADQESGDPRVHAVRRQRAERIAAAIGQLRWASAPMRPTSTSVRARSAKDGSSPMRATLSRGRCCGYRRQPARAWRSRGPCGRMATRSVAGWGGVWRQVPALTVRDAGVRGDGVSEERGPTAPRPHPRRCSAPPCGHKGRGYGTEPPSTIRRWAANRGESYVRRRPRSGDRAQSGVSLHHLRRAAHARAARDESDDGRRVSARLSRISRTSSPGRRCFWRARISRA